MRESYLDFSIDRGVISFILGMKHLYVRAPENVAMGIYVYMLRCADGSFYVGSATGDDLSAASTSTMPDIIRAIRSRGGRLFWSGRSISIE